MIYNKAEKQTAPSFSALFRVLWQSPSSKLPSHWEFIPIASQAKRIKHVKKFPRLLNTALSVTSLDVIAEYNYLHCDTSAGKQHSTPTTKPPMP